MRKTLLWTVLIAVAGVGPFVGTVPLSWEGVWLPQSLEHQVFMQLRLPRVVLGFGVGALLALSGLVFQTLFRNALMTPYTLGVSSGAVLGAGIGIKLGVTTLFWGLSATMLFGLAGAWMTVGLVLYLSRFIVAFGQQSLLLLGLALSFFYTSALTVLYYMGSFVENHEILRFTMGSLSVVGFSSSWIILGAAVAVLGVVYVTRHALAIMALSDEQAQLKGINTRRLTYLLLGAVSMAVGLAVSIVGPIGFVGLVVPHIVMLFYKRSTSRLIFPTFMMGGLFLVACDTVAKALSGTSELPIGVVTALIGAPFFMALILRKS